MATVTNVKLTITGSSTPGKSQVAVAYDIGFDTYDLHSWQRYRERVTLWASDMPPSDPDDVLGQVLIGTPEHPTYVSAGLLPQGATTLQRKHTRQFSNSTLNEDLGSSDEIYAVVELEPRPPTSVTVRSSILTLNL